MTKISTKQKLILDFLKAEVRDKGYPPSVREICDAVSLKSTSTVHAHLGALEKKGYIRRDPTKPRAIEILDTEPLPSNIPELVLVPIVGTVTAGAPIFAEENIEDTFPIPSTYIGNDDVFMLKIKGDSMIEAGIFNKDLILVNQQSTADNGDIVVAMIEEYATVKRFFREDGLIRLQPENSTMSPILLRDCVIAGKVIGLFRKMD
ncbi:MAG: transcriptional repressor LexA [Anaerotignaceae bacterium]